MKRAGGRRYYRPDDVALLRRILRQVVDELTALRDLLRAPRK